jgi:hypothetical protein
MDDEFIDLLADALATLDKRFCTRTLVRIKQRLGVAYALGTLDEDAYRWRLRQYCAAGNDDGRSQMLAHHGLRG